MVRTINSTFQLDISLDPKPCILAILEDVTSDVNIGEAVSRGLFQARKLILQHWTTQSLLTPEMWLTNMGVTLRYERLIYQHGAARLGLIRSGNAGWLLKFWPHWT